MTQEDKQLVIQWFKTIMQLATDRKNANGFVMTDTDALLNIKIHAKDAVDYIENCTELESIHPQPHAISIRNATKFAALEYKRGVQDGLNHQWKPSKEQMEALSETLEFMPDTFKPT